MEFIGLSRSQVNVAASIGRQFRLGTLGSFDDTEFGTQIYLYVQVVQAVIRGSLVLTLTGEEAIPLTTAIAGPAVGQGHQIGAVQAVMGIGDFGWMQVYGRGPALTEGLAGASRFLNTTDEAGSLDDDGSALTIAVPGIILDTATGASQAVNESAHFNWPSAGAVLS